MSSQAAVLIPVFIQIALTLTLLMMTGRARWEASRAGAVRMRDIALGQTEPWPERPAKLARAYQNQFETPTLFYVAVILALVTGKADAGFVMLEWLWLAARLAHARVHVTTNHVPTRFRLFLASVVALIALWVWFAVRTLATG